MPGVRRVLGPWSLPRFSPIRKAGCPRSPVPRSPVPRSPFPGPFHQLLTAKRFRIKAQGRDSALWGRGPPSPEPQRGSTSRRPHVSTIVLMFGMRVAHCDEKKTRFPTRWEISETEPLETYWKNKAETQNGIGKSRAKLWPAPISSRPSRDRLRVIVAAPAHLVPRAA